MCEFKEDVYLKYIEDGVTNFIDFKNSFYIRENNEYLLKIDFKKNNFSYTLKENDYNLSSEISSCKLIIEKDIILEYSLDTEIKKIIVQIL